MLLLSFAATVAVVSARPATYTATEARAGAAVYAQRCAQCHGANLQGGAGPPLKGAALQKGYPTASDLHDFIQTQMPANAPGSLSGAQYDEVTAFLLQQNGRLGPAKSKKPSGKFTGKSGASKGTPPPGNFEITRTVPPQTKRYAPIPSGADVALTDQRMIGAASDGKDWPIDGRTYDNERYSPLSQIDTSNVASLTPVAIVQTGVTASFETTPIVIDGVMYLTTGTADNQTKVMAVNAATGRRIWETTYQVGPFQICCGPVNRGAAVAYGMVYFVTLDNKLHAVDARTGAQRWVSTVADQRLGYSETLAPIAYDGMVFVGSAGGEWAIRGFVAAYDAKTGKQRWRWWATDPKTYAGDSWKSGGAMVWTTPALDPQRHLLIFSTGNPNPDLNGTARKGDNLWSDSIVALDARTGTFKWGYQEVKHDVWDYDATSPVVLFDVNVNGKTVPAAGEAGKVGWFFIVNRDNGKLIRKSAPYVRMSKNMFSTPTRAGVRMLPGANGGAEWSPAAYSPQTHDAYVLAMDQLMNFTTAPVHAAKGHLRLGSAFTNVSPEGLQDGRFVAINTENGRIDWTAMTAQPLIGGALATAGDLVFMGEGDGNFDAFDARTGRKLWAYNLGAGVNAPPISYEVNGQQYIAVAAGGNFQLGYPYGDALAIFRLK